MQLEIARLQHSVQRLNETQEMLREAIASDPDPELTKALEENQTVMFVAVLVHVLQKRE